MECTQRLECTQDLYDSPTEKLCPEQIGFLGICGTKYPVKKGPNKIGRDPQTCQIVLQLESISRQHAVINILNKTEFMLMDLDSANKTKLMDKTLQPYIPHPLRNGDTVQFGKIFGIFRLLEEDNELPMTQALDIPDTPITNRHVSRVHAPITTIPESPEVSDRDDSFIAPSQPKLPIQLKNESNNFIKPAAKTISIQPIGSKKIDNVYWNSSKKSTSIGSTFEESNQSMNDSTISVNKSNNMDLHEMETQPPAVNVNNVSIDSIYNANTQMPDAYNPKAARVSADGIYTANTQMPNADHNVSVDAIYNANTQLPSACNQNVSVDSIYMAETQAPDNQNPSPPIHSLETQMPVTENLPSVCKVNNQQEMEFDFCAANKENDISIFNAETQPVLNTSKKPHSLTNAIKSNKSNNETTKSSFHTSEEEILFEDLDESFEDEFESQSLLPESQKKRNKQNQKENKTDPFVKLNKPAKRDVRIKSDSSTDCDDIEIAATQQLPKPAEDDLTDCEDDNNMKTGNLSKSNDQNEMFEDMLTQVLDDELPKINHSTITKSKAPNKLSLASTSKVPFEDMLTQVIEEEQAPKSTTADIHFEDMPTQVICNEINLPEKINIEEMQTQVLQEDIPQNVKKIKRVSNEFVSPFKVPLQSPRKAKRKDTPKDNKTKDVHNTDDNHKVFGNCSEKEDKYYEATQDILDDLCTQPLSPEILPIRQEDDDVVPCSVEDEKTGEFKLPGLDYDISPKSSDKSSESNIDEKLNHFVSNLSIEQIRDVIGVQPLKKQPSDPSDTEATPKKVHPMKFFETDLPDSQEIKTSVSLHYKSNVTESSSESETENDSEEQFTPILYRKKRKPKVDAKLDLMKKLDVDALPSRVSTRVRKPALKLQDSEATVKKVGENMLKPKFLTEQEGEIDNEIIIENISRLKNKNDKNEKNKSNTDANTSNLKLKNESKIDEQPKEKRKSDEKKEEATKIEHSSKDKQKHEDSKDNDKKIDNISKEKRNVYDIKDQDSKHERSTKDKRKKDDVKENASKSERSKRDNLKSDHIKEEKSVSKVSRSKTLDSHLLSIDLTSERSKRSTRNRNKHNLTEKETENHSTSLEKEKDKKVKKDDEKRKKSNKKDDKQESNVKEVRRSRRQRSYKEKKEDDSLIKVKITKPAKKEVKKEVKPVQAVQMQHEKSAVYSVSSDSGTDSPKRLKRAATETLRAPSPKRTRSATNAANSTSSTCTSTSSSLRSTPARRLETQRVLFTAFPFDEVRNKLESLGAVVVSDVTACSVLVTLHVKRTFKLLCAVGLGRPIVGSAWVQACADNNCIVDPWLYLLKDEAAEQRFKFSLHRTLTSKRNFLKGYNVSSTPNVKPTTAEMILIVECSGGVWAEGGPNWLCVSCSADRALWPALAARGARVVSSELVLGGVLRQKLDIAAAKLA